MDEFDGIFDRHDESCVVGPVEYVATIGEVYADSKDKYWEVVAVEPGIIWMKKPGDVIAHPFAERYFSLYFPVLVGRAR